MKINENTNWILENLKKLRKLNGKASFEIANAIEISNETYSKLENGGIRDYYKYLPKIAHALGVGFLELINPPELINDDMNLKINETLEFANSEIKTDPIFLLEKIIEEYKKTLVVNKDILILKEELLLRERELSDRYKRKYLKLKSKLILLNEKLKSEVVQGVE